MAEPVYRRVVIKLSGEYLAGSHSFGIDQPTIDHRVVNRFDPAQNQRGGGPSAPTRAGHHRGQR